MRDDVTEGRAVNGEMRVAGSHATNEALPPEIQRDALLNLLTTLLDGAVRILVVEGDEGIGKTTLFRQFGQAHVDNSISLFISGASRWAYSPIQIASEFCSQLHYLLRRQELPPQAPIDDSLLQRYLNELARRTRGSGRLFYFLLDGLDEIPEADESSRQQVLDLLPLGVEPFRFLISGDANRLGISVAARRTLKATSIPGFTHEESDRYLTAIGFAKDQLSEVYKLTAGVPGTLATVYRILVAADDPVATLSRLPEELPELFALEWRAVDRQDKHHVLTLALLAHDGRSYTTTEIATILLVEPDRVERVLSRFKFLERDSHGDWRFVSEECRRYASRQLDSSRSKINDLLIDHYLKTPDSAESLANLPSYFTSAEKLTELVQYLSPERFARLYQSAASLRLVQQKAEQGMAAARRLGRDGDFVRFTIQKCTIEEIAQPEVALSEISARTAVGDYEAAFALAEAPSRLEAKFRLLARLARARKEQNLSPDPLLDARIRSLFEQLQPGALGDQVSETASDLFYSAPDLAIELVSRAAGSSSG